MQVNISMNGTVCVNETGICWPTVQQAINNATTGQIVVITDNATYSESVIINKSLIITSNTTRPTIRSSSAHTAYTGDYLVTISKVNLEMSTNSDHYVIYGNATNITDASIDTIESKYICCSGSRNKREQYARHSVHLIAQGYLPTIHPF
jgi:hypothetical protein